MLKLRRWAVLYGCGPWVCKQRRRATAIHPHGLRERSERNLACKRRVHQDDGRLVQLRQPRPEYPGPLRELRSWQVLCRWPGRLCELRSGHLQGHDGRHPVRQLRCGPVHFSHGPERVRELRCGHHCGLGWFDGMRGMCCGHLQGHDRWHTVPLVRCRQVLVIDRHFVLLRLCCRKVRRCRRGNFLPCLPPWIGKL